MLTARQTDFREFAFSVEIRHYLLERSVESHPTFMLLQKENKAKSCKILYSLLTQGSKAFLPKLLFP